MRSLVLVCPLLAACLAPEALVDSLLDADGDGQRTHVIGGPDCDDANAEVRSGGTEICGNALDDDCDGATDDVGAGALRGFRDADLDGFGHAASPVVACVLDADVVRNDDDCDDRRADVRPGAPEDCRNERDDDCDSIVDELEAPVLWWPDADGDGHGAGEARAELTCTPPRGFAARTGDCDDARADVYPLATDVPYDGVDQDCLLGSDFDLDGDGFPVDPEDAVPPVTDPRYAPGRFGLDCDDRAPEVFPGAEDPWYDGVDQDCDGADDFDQDGDGFAASSWGGGDCDDEDPTRNPGAAEVFYDDVDQDCVPANDDDRDGDGYPGRSVTGDCDDGDPDVWTSCAACLDFDRDGRWSGCDAYVVREPDCNDRDDWMWDTCASCGDADGDGFFGGCNRYSGSFEDCDDANPEAWNTCATCADADGDGAWAGCNRLVVHAPDCDDRLANAWTTCAGCTDADGDTWGVGSCHGGPADCDDANGDAWFACATCADADDDGSRAGCDRHAVQPFDCDDARADVGGTPPELLADGVDQDCDGLDLVPQEAYGRFVSTTGIDAAACGTRATPCGTLEYAARLASASGQRAIFAAAGRYAGGTTSVSVYGGFHPTTWVRDPVLHVTEVVDGGEHVLRTTGAKVDLDGLVLRDTTARPSWIGVRAEAWATNVVDVEVLALAAHEYCRGIYQPKTGLVQGIDATISLQACRTSATGVEVGSLGQHAKGLISNSSIAAGRGARPATVSRGIVIHGVLVVERSQIDCEASTDVMGIDLADSGSAAITDSEVTAFGRGNCRTIAILSRNTSFINVDRSISSIAGCARGAALELARTTAGRGDVLARNSAFTGFIESGEALVAVTAPASVAPRLTLHGVSIIAFGGGTALRAGDGSAVSMENSAIQSDGIGLDLRGSEASLDHVFVDAASAATGGGGPEGNVTTEFEFTACDWDGCLALNNSRLGPLHLTPGSRFGIVPKAMSPLVQAGKISDWATLDVFRKPRQSPPTIGACEP